MLSEFSIDLLDEGTRFRSILQVPTFHRRDTILCDFISERNSREERINRNGKILKTDCRFIDLPEGTICAGRQRRKISRCEEIHYRLFCTLENRNIEYGQFVKTRNRRDKFRNKFANLKKKIIIRISKSIVPRCKLFHNRYVSFIIVSVEIGRF